MKKQLLLAAIALGLTCTANAVEISNRSGQSCGAATGTWHFVNNQYNRAGPGILDATWSSGNSCSVSPSAVTRGVQHFYCIGSGELLSASTNLPGRLVLSDFVCDEVKPPCDPKKEKCDY